MVIYFQRFEIVLNKNIYKPSRMTLQGGREEVI